MRPLFRCSDLILITGFALLLFATPALAVDGVLEINQTCAVQTGCFGGDTAGWPVTITQSGSYVLTSNLTVPDENATAVELTAHYVAIDFNRFSIIRSGCEDQNLDCPRQLGAGKGVFGPFKRGVSLGNGSIVGMGNDGIVLGGLAEVSDLRILWNGFRGIVVGESSTVSRNIVTGNGNDGIYTFGSAVKVMDNIVRENLATGINASFHSSVRRNILYSNGSIAGGAELRLEMETTYSENRIHNGVSGVTVSGGINMGDNYCSGGTSPSCP